MKKAWIVLTVAFWAVHQVQLTTENDFGCSDQTTLPLTVYPGYQAGLSALPLSGCSPLEVSFEALPGAATYLWDFGDGRMSHETTPTHTYQAPGTYQVQLTATGPGGTSQSSEVQVRVYQNPTALFDVVPKIIYLPGERPVFINRSENASDYLWDMGDGGTYRDFAPNHTYTQPGLYTIGLTAISAEGCEDSYQNQNEYQQLDAGVYWLNHPLELGIWYRGLPLFSKVEQRINHDALILLMSYMYGPFRIGYSYDLTLSGLAAQSAGAHEISLIYEFNQRANLRLGGRRPAVPCSDVSNPLIQQQGKYQHKSRSLF